MPLVFACITPHSPLLAPTVGRENSVQLTKTLNSFQTLKEDLYVARAETIIIISPHGSTKNSAFVMNLAPEYNANLEKFGDYSTKSTFSGDVGLTYQIRENLEDKVKIQLVTDSQLDYGCYIPLLCMSNSSNNEKIIPVYESTQDVQAHFDFGKLLQREIAYSNKRIAVVASADLSHKLNKNNPIGYSPKAEKFDSKLIEFLQKSQTSEILKFKPELLTEVAECGLKSISTLLGILSGLNNEPEKMSYEAPFGVGCLVMRFHL